jgi:hypothetical protein
MENEINDAKRKAIADLCFEMSASMTRAEGERDFQKEAIKNIAEKFELDKKMLRKIARIHHQSKFSTVQEENSELESMYKTVFEAKAI